MAERTAIVEYDPEANLAYAFSTWVYLLHAAGITPDDSELVTHCRAVDAAQASEEGDAAGGALVERVRSFLGSEADPDRVIAVAAQLYGSAVVSDFGAGERSDRNQRIRRYQFDRTLPWLARIYERQISGAVRPAWVLVERVTDRVSLLDPNPWNDIDEDRKLPVSDFQVLWELDGCRSVAVS